jgi:hypothetical protein
MHQFVGQQLGPVLTDGDGGPSSRPTDGLVGFGGVLGVVVIQARQIGLETFGQVVRWKSVVMVLPSLTSTDSVSVPKSRRQ